MSEKRKILIQLDSDPHPSAFDRVVAIDSGVDELFSYGNVAPAQVAGLVHGAIFTRKASDLKRTAIFIGGSDVAQGEKLLAEAQKAMIPSFGLTVSVLLDSNGANTTAAAAVRVAAKHMDLSSVRALVLGGTGPVGQRVGRLLARQGAHVRLASRQLAKATSACFAIAAAVGRTLEPAAVAGSDDLPAACEGRNLIVAAGAAGVVLLPASARKACKELKVCIDLNAVPPLGVEGVDVIDKAKDRDGVICYGAIGVGNTKMQLHRAAVAKLFEANNQVIDAEEVYALGEGM